MKFLDNQNIRMKLAISASVPFMLLLLLGAVSYLSIENLLSSGKWVNHAHEVVAEADGVVASAIEMETGMLSYLLAGDEKFLEPYHQGSKNFHQQIKDLRENVSEMPEQVARLEKSEEIIDKWIDEIVKPVIGTRRQIGDAATTDEMAQLVAAKVEGKVFFQQFRQTMSEFIAEENHLLAEKQASNNNAATFAELAIVICVVAGLLLGTALSLFIGNAIAKPIVQLAGKMKELADNNLDVEITGTERLDEIGTMSKTVQVFKDNAIEQRHLEKIEQERVTKLDVLIDQFDLGAQATLKQFDGASRALTQIAGDITSAVDQSTSSVHSVAAASEELANSVREIAQNTSQSRDIANKSVDQVQSASASVEKLASELQNIASVAELIGDIAEQTNLLALNATIESARAGEAGRGFAVVAAEVKALANRTGKATNEISSKVSALLDRAKSATGTMQQVQETIKCIDENIMSIAGAIEEQEATTCEIAENAQSAAGHTETVGRRISANNENTSEMEDVRSATENLYQAADSLGTEIQKFLKEVRAA